MIKSQKSKVKTKSQNQKSKLKSFNLLLAVFTFYFLLLPFVCYAQPVSSTELINKAKDYDGKTVTYEGEVIGDVMARKDFAWLNINDGQNAIGVWIAQNLTHDIVYIGSYKAKGDWVEVMGLFQRACPQHGGDLDIHAQAIRKMRPGRLVNGRLNPDKVRFAGVLLGILALVWILRILKRK